MIFVFIPCWFVLAVVYIARPRVALFLYMITLPFFPFYWNPINVVPFNDLSIQRMLAIGIGLGMVVESAIRGFKQITDKERLKAEVLVAGIVFIWSLSAFNDNTFSAGTRNLTFNLLDFWVPFSIATRFVRNDIDILFLFKLIAIPAVLIAVIVFWEYFLQVPVAYDWFSKIHQGEYDQIWTPSMRGTLLRIQATFGQSIFLSFYLVSASLINGFIGSNSTDTKKTVHYIVAAFLMICALFTTARGAVIGGFIAVFCFFMMTGGQAWKRILKVVLVISIGIIIVGTLFEDTSTFWGGFISSVTGQASGSEEAHQLNTWEYRLDLVDTGLRVLLNSPVLGYGNLSIGDRWGIPDLTNVFIEVGIVSGLIGLLLLLFLIAKIIRKLSYIWKRERINGNRNLAALVTALFILIMTCWLDSSWPGQFTQISWLLFGVIFSWSIYGAQSKLR